MVIKRLYQRYKQFGGFRLIWKYIQMGVFPTFLQQGFNVLIKKQSIEDSYSIIQNRTIPHIFKQYGKLLNSLMQKYAEEKSLCMQSNKIWFCWLQGLEKAPEVVRICYNSLKRNLINREIIVLSEANIEQYVTFPEFIIKKYHQGIIPMAHFTDLLRLELLIKYGGVWIDATVLCTGNQGTEEMFNSSLFLFQRINGVDNRFQGISNWLVVASPNHRLVLILRDLLYRYWSDYNCLIAYYIFHIFFSMIAEQMPEEIAKMPRKSNKLCFYLENRLSDVYDDEWMKELTKRCVFHKLSCRLWDNAINVENSFLRHIKAYYC